MALYNQAGSTPVLVHCLDGAGHCAVYAAASIICEKMGCEDQVNVFLTVKELKHRRDKAINTLVCPYGEHHWYAHTASTTGMPIRRAPLVSHTASTTGVPIRRAPLVT